MSFENINFFRSEEIQGASQNFYPTKKGWVTIFSLGPNMEDLIYINYSWGGPWLFSKLTKGGPGELIYMLMGIPPPPPPPPPSLLINECTLTGFAETKSTSCGLVHNIMELSVLYGGVAVGKIETLRDGETSVFLCETESFPLFKLRDRNIWDFWTLRKKSRLRDLKSAEKNETARPLKFG